MDDGILSAVDSNRILSCRTMGFYVVQFLIESCRAVAASLGMARW